ncbi:ATP-binding protein [Spirosoma soli]|uniref:histidine kinase n=1 Tax=Spirosoma soli TaxID=1770529 RepID=A0ABW5M3J1_9BACT
MITNLPTQPPELLLESILQNSLTGVLLCQAVRDESRQIIDFQVLWCNDQAVAMARMPREQILTETMLTSDPEGWDSGIFDKYRQVAETGVPMQIEHHYVAGNIWMAQSLTRFEDGVLASWSDITSLKEAERSQQQETELLQAILDNTQTGIVVMQSVRNESGRVVDFQFTHVNVDAERMTLRSKEDLVDQLYTTVWPAAQTNGVLDWHIKVAETGAPAKIDSVYLSVDGYEGWFNIRIRPFRDGVIATFVNVTALKRAELANQQQTELLRSVLDSSSNAIIAFSAIRDTVTGKIVDFRYEAQNEANRRNPTRTDEEVIGHTMLEYFPHVIATGLFDRYVQVIETGESTRFEQEYNYDELSGWYELSVVKWGDGIVLTLVDITASKGYQRQIEQSNRELMHVNDNLRQFAYVASHDLQEPLRKIVAFGDMLQEQFAPQLGELGQDIISRMQLATGRMSALIKDVLAYSRITTHREPFRFVALNDILADICHQVQSEYAEMKVSLNVSELPTIRGDHSQLHQLFGNLLMNAIKFRPTNRQPVVHVSCQTVPGAAGPPGLNPNLEYHEICVADNGIGFDEKHAERIFQVFQRLHNRQRYDGTGVGLAICKRVVENHHGLITASGKLDEGATFRVYLPV